MAGSPEGETNGLDGDTCTDKDVCKSPIISEKLVSNSVDVSCVDGNGSTPLILGAFHGHKEIVYTLLLYSADANAQDYQGWVRGGVYGGHGTGLWVGTSFRVYSPMHGCWMFLSTGCECVSIHMS